MYFLDYFNVKFLSFASSEFYLSALYLFHDSLYHQSPCAGSPCSHGSVGAPCDWLLGSGLSRLCTSFPNLWLIFLPWNHFFLPVFHPNTVNLSVFPLRCGGVYVLFQSSFSLTYHPLCSPLKVLKLCFMMFQSLYICRIYLQLWVPQKS